MKLLIVDDEAITREGIVQRLPWTEMGIDEIRQADDGINAIEIARKFNPDIILTDVRMPRMDGIQMAFGLKAFSPNCKIIFMSGYSDKEYLLSAIELKAVSYVEKPIRINELIRAIESAIALCKEAMVTRNTEFIAKTFTKVGIPLLKNEIALLISNNNLDLKIVNELSKDACINLPVDGLFNTLLVKFVLDDGFSHSQLSKIRTTLSNSLYNLYSQMGINCLSCLKDNTYIVIHLYGNSYEKHLFTKEKLLQICNDIVHSMEGIDKYFISIGNTVQGLINVPNSYNIALSNMKMVFFEGYNKIFNITEINYPQFNFKARPIKTFIELIEENKWNPMIFYIKSLISEFKIHRTTPVNSIKNYFISILLELYRYSKSNGINIFQDFEYEANIREIILRFETLSEVEEFLIEKINAFFENANQINKCFTVNKIYKYIQDYYSDENLSINKISEYTHFAPTYVCSLFKEKTGKTLNQYITEYRIEKSNELLKNLKLNISDIGSMVGYSNSGYFTKLYRKVTGITPSEYREKLIL